MVAPWHLVLVVLSAWRARGADRENLLQYASAALLAFLTFGRVLSPRYLLWSIPLLACVDGRAGVWARRFYVPACAATLVIFPIGFEALSRLEPWVIALLDLRNGLLVAAWGVLTFSTITAEASRVHV